MTDNDIPYGDLTFFESHPGTLAAVGTLLGLRPPAVDTCRVLEIGCGTGFNILGMSQSLPGAHFTGLDISPLHIERARQAAAAIGASNIEFHCLSLTDFPVPAGSFDYIIGHGVYSWVPPEIREALPGVIRHLLAPHGLAYLSYNTYPGWRIRGVVRDLMNFFAQPAQTTEERVALARQGAEFLCQSLSNPDSIYSKAVLAETTPLIAAQNYYLAHEYLADNNYPILFQDFVRHAGAYDLQYVGEARFLANSFAQRGDTRAQLNQAGTSDIIRREQLLDFIVGRYFRQSILCQAGLPIDRAQDTTALLPLNVALTADVLEQAHGAWRVRTILGVEITIDDEPSLCVLRKLAERGQWPVKAMDFKPEILNALGDEVIPGIENAITAAVLINGWRLGIWSIRAGTPTQVSEVSPNPVACPFARLQAAAGPLCTNRLHRAIQLTSEEQALLPLLDGTHVRDDNPALVSLAAKGFLVA